MPHDVPAEFRTINWLPPWQPTDADLGAELTREIGAEHVLAGRPVVALGRRIDCDDVLFWLPSGPAALAVVHLTWTGKRECDPQWPATRLYDSLAEWIAKGMHADHGEFTG